MSGFLNECISAFSSFVNWSFSTPSGLGVSVGGLIAGINVLAVIVHYLWNRYK